MKWRHRKNSLPVTGKISHAFSRLFDEYTPKKTETFKNKARSYRIDRNWKNFHRSIEVRFFNSYKKIVVSVLFIK